ncbi:MAG: heavy-metal-associated domain-containing protein [Anaerolineales bacterium]
MEKITLDLPTMYADHHVIEVRRILFEVPGVQDVYASSAFHKVEVTFDPEKVNRVQLFDRLADAGYVGDLPVPVEFGAQAVPGNGDKPFFRHTAVYETTRSVVSFAQRVNYEGRPLWPCPGMGPLQTLKPVEE